MAGLVPCVVHNNRFLLGWPVVRTCRSGGESTAVAFGEIAMLPPSCTTSGLFGHGVENPTPVLLKGDSSPGVRPMSIQRRSDHP